MSYAKPLSMRVDAAATRSQRNPARISLKAEQHYLIAAAYEKAAADMSLPGHTRAAFTRKADWFRLLARVGEKKKLAASLASKANQKAQQPLPNPFWFWGLQAYGDESWHGDFYRMTH
jgi:hypothetical protein